MATFLDTFPLVRYTLDKKLSNEYDVVRNILFRIGVIGSVIEANAGAYYYYIIKDSDRPEILAEKLYGNPEAYWMILYANNIYDPYYDWPMEEKVFNKYIIKKYGSLEYAKTNWHHYEKVITRENPAAQVKTVTKFQVNEKKLTNDILTMTDVEIDYNIGEPVFVGTSYGSNTFSGKVVAWNMANGYIELANTTGSIKSYQFLIGANTGANGTVLTTVWPSVPMDAYNTLVDTTNFSTYTVAGRTVFETISRNRVSYYDYEYELNESKRQIKIIKPEYYAQIRDEFESIVSNKSFYKRPL